MSESNKYLKDFGQYTLSDYQQFRLAQQNQKLYNISNRANEKMFQKKIDERIYNLSISKIGKNFTVNLLDILNDLVSFIYKLINKEEEFNFNKLVSIFIKDERLIYSGILLVLLSLFIYFMDISS